MLSRHRFQKRQSLFLRFDNCHPRAVKLDKAPRLRISVFRPFSIIFARIRQWKTFSHNLVPRVEKEGREGEPGNEVAFCMKLRWTGPRLDCLPMG